jgi:hypothetical protein
MMNLVSPSSTASYILFRPAVPYFIFDLQVPEAADRGRSTQARTGSDDLSQGTNTDKKKLMLIKLNII